MRLRCWRGSVISHSVVAACVALPVKTASLPSLGLMAARGVQCLRGAYSCVVSFVAGLRCPLLLVEMLLGRGVLCIVVPPNFMLPSFVSGCCCLVWALCCLLRVVVLGLSSWSSCLCFRVASDFIAVCAGAPFPHLRVLVTSKSVGGHDTQGCLLFLLLLSVPSQRAGAVVSRRDFGRRGVAPAPRFQLCVRCTRSWLDACTAPWLEGCCL